MNLTELAEKYSTDKNSSGHNYFPAYEKRLPKKCRSMCEIGVAKGQSALLWQNYYGEELDLHVIDLFKDEDHVSPAWCKRNFITPHIGDQSDLGFLGEIKEKFQIVIDDGSHNAHHMLISWMHLFHNNLESGGQYWIEDCQANEEPFYWGGLVNSYEDTPISMFSKFLKTGQLINPYINYGQNEMFKSLIDKVEILCDKKLILITRK